MKKLDKFKKDKNIPKLINRLEKGMYNERIAVLEILGNMEANSSIPAIEKKIDDKVEVVSQKAMATLEKLSIDNSIAEKIKNKREYWINLKSEKKKQKENIRILKEETVKKNKNRAGLDFSQENRSKVSSKRITGPSKAVAGVGAFVGIIIFIKIILFILKHLSD